MITVLGHQPFGLTVAQQKLTYVLQSTVLLIIASILNHYHLTNIHILSYGKFTLVVNSCTEFSLMMQKSLKQSIKYHHPSIT